MGSEWLQRVVDAHPSHRDDKKNTGSDFKFVDSQNKQICCKRQFINNTQKHRHSISNSSNTRCNREVGINSNTQKHRTNN